MLSSCRGETQAEIHETLVTNDGTIECFPKDHPALNSAKRLAEFCFHLLIESVVLRRDCDARFFGHLKYSQRKIHDPPLTQKGDCLHQTENMTIVGDTCNIVYFSWGSNAAQLYK